MDGLSGAASVMAAVSLTIQLVGTVNNLREFWLGMKSAPAEVKDIVDNLALLNSILYGVDRAYALHDDPNDHDPDHAKSIYLALLRCQSHVNKMKVFADSLQNDFAKKRYRTAFKTVLQKPKIAEFATHLEQAKTTLLMAINVTTLLLQGECGKAVQAQFSALRSDMMDFAMDIASSALQPPSVAPDSLSKPPPPYQEQKRKTKYSEMLCSKSSRITASDILLWLVKLPPDSPYRKSLTQYGRLVGRIAWQSSTRLVNNSEGEYQSLEDSMIISIELPIVRRAFTMRSQKAFGQWTHAFRVSRIVPDDSPIFKICATKDTATVRKLFDSGKASPFDQTASGVTLLHAAAAGYRCQTYGLLCDAGVEYGLCEDSLYGKLAPIELTQSFTVSLEGKLQTVQEWLGIHEEQDQVLHPERNYDCVTRIWTHSIEIQDEISDSEIMTMLQGPLRSPRDTELLVDLAKQASSTNQTMARYSSTHLLFCYYFLFHQDPYGCPISKATLYLPSLGREMPLYEYVGQYWDREEWLELLKRCEDLDFRKLGQRQQDKHDIRSPDSSIWEVGPGGRKIARISSSVDIYFNVWIGPVRDWEAVFEFEGEYESTIPQADDPVETSEEPAQQVASYSESKSASPDYSYATLGIIKYKSPPIWLYWTFLSIALHYVLYYHIFGRSNFSS